MVAKTLAVIACLLLVSCQPMHARLTAARAVELSNTRLAASLPRDLPENCTAEMAHVQPSAAPLGSLSRTAGWFSGKTETTRREHVELGGLTTDPPYPEKRRENEREL